MSRGSEVLRGYGIKTLSLVRRWRRSAGGASTWLASQVETVYRSLAQWGLRFRMRTRTTSLSRKLRGSLQKARPQSLEESYELTSDSGVVRDAFYHLRTKLYHATNSRTRSGKVVFRESGYVGPDRPYFYLKPEGEVGWLFEQSPVGWTLSKAEKIVKDDTFLRQGTPVDRVTLYSRKPERSRKKGPLSPRVDSQMLGARLLATSFYEQKLTEELDLSAED